MTANPADAVREALELTGVVFREYGHMKAVDAMNTVEDSFAALTARVAELDSELSEVRATLDTARDVCAEWKAKHDRLAALAWAAPDWVIKAINSADEMLTQQGFAHTDLRAARDYIAQQERLRTPNEIMLAYENLLVDHERLKVTHAPAKADEERDMAVLDKYAEVARALGFEGDAWFGDPLASHAEIVARASAKAREVTEDMVQRGIDAFNDTYEAEFFSTGRISDNKAQAIRAVLDAALATFAEGD